MKMHLLVLAGLAIGSAVFSGCTNGHSASSSGQQQNTSVNSHARTQGGYPQSNTFVDWNNPATYKSNANPKQAENEGYGGGP
jgi:hypothetical protein